MASQGQVTVPEVIEHVWRHLAHQILQGNVDNLKIPSTFKAVIGSQGLDVLATRALQMIAKPLDIIEDSNLGIIHFVPVIEPAKVLPNTKTLLKKKHPAPEKTAKVPRPPNAFILFRQHHHPLVKAAQPDLHNNQISIILGNQWKMEDESSKAKWREMAAIIKAKHLQDFPDYLYQPRKSSEKKRRMTRRKAQALAGKPKASTKTTTAINGSASSSTSAAAVEDISSSSATALAVQAQEHTTSPVSTVTIPMVVPNLDTTPNGKPILHLGGDYDDSQLAATLEAYNKFNPGFNNADVQEWYGALPSIIAMKSDTESQNDQSFYENAMDLDQLNDAYDAAMAQLEEENTAIASNHGPGSNSYEDLGIFDANNDLLMNAEFARMSTLF